MWRLDEPWAVGEFCLTVEQIKASRLIAAVYCLVCSCFYHGLASVRIDRTIRIIIIVVKDDPQ